MVGMVGSVPLHLHSLRVNGGLEAVLSRPTALSRALIRTHENHASTEEEKDQQLRDKSRSPEKACKPLRGLQTPGLDLDFPRPLANKQ